jgi:hypothetical protein
MTGKEQKERKRKGRGGNPYPPPPSLPTTSAVVDIEEEEEEKDGWECKSVSSTTSNQTEHFNYKPRRAMSTISGSSSSGVVAHEGKFNVRFHPSSRIHVIPFDHTKPSIREAIDHFCKKNRSFKLVNWDCVYVYPDDNTSVKIEAGIKAGNYANQTLQIKKTASKNAADFNNLEETAAYMDVDSRRSSFDGGNSSHRSFSSPLHSPAPGSFNLNMNDVHADGAVIGNQLSGGSSIGQLQERDKSAREKRTFPKPSPSTVEERDDFVWCTAESTNDACNRFDRDLEGLTAPSGVDSSVDQQFIDKLVQTSKSVCRLRPKGKRATAFVVFFDLNSKTGLIITNNHVLPRLESAIDAVLDFHMVEDDVIDPKCQGECKPSTFFATSKSLDASVVAFAMTPKSTKKASFSCLPLCYNQSDHIKTDPRVYIIHHPRGKSRRFSLQVGKIDLVDQCLHYRNDTLKGSSGSPVLSYDMRVVALHRAGIAKKSRGKFLKHDGSVWNQGDKVEEQAFLCNEGVVVDFILDWLCFDVPSEISDLSKLELLDSLLKQDHSAHMQERRSSIIMKMEKMKIQCNNEILVD